MKKKILMTLSIITCAVALVVSSVVGTMAFLRAQAEITNTFTYGKVTITMDETLVNENGTPVSPAQRTKVGNNYMLVANTEYVKDPVIHIDPSSVDMYLFLKVDNGIFGLATTEAGKTIHEQLLANGWKVYEDEDSTKYRREIKIDADAGLEIKQTSTVYYLSEGPGAEQKNPLKVNGTYKTSETAVAGDIPTFAYFHTGTINVTEASMTAYINHNAKIVVNAYAVQASGFDGVNGIHEAAAVFASDFINSSETPGATPPGSTLTPNP